MAKATLKDIDSIVSKSIEKSVKKVVVKKVTKAVQDKIENIEGNSVRLKSVKLKPIKSSSSKVKNENKALKEITAPKDINTGVDIGIMVSSPKYTMMKYAYYIYRIVSGTPVDESYSKVERFVTIPTLRKAKSFFRKNNKSIPRIEKTKIKYHKADTESIRDYWEFDITTENTKTKLTMKDFSSINFDSNLSKRKVEAIVNILMKATNNEPIKEMAVNIGGDDDMKERFKVLEFGKYENKISTWDQSNTKGNRKHGVVNGYSVQAPLGILACAQVEQDTVNTILQNRLNDEEKSIVDIFDKFFRNYTTFLNNVKKAAFVLSVPNNTTFSIDEGEDTKYMSTLTFLDTTYKGSFGRAAKDAILKNLDNSKTFGTGLSGSFRTTASAELKFFKSKNVKFSKRIEKLDKWENEEFAKREEKRRQKELEKAEKDRLKAEAREKRTKLLIEAISNPESMGSIIAANSFNLDNYKDYEIIVSGLWRVDKNLEDLRSVLQSIQKNIKEEKEYEKDIKNKIKIVKDRLKAKVNVKQNNSKLISLENKLKEIKNGRKKLESSRKKLYKVTHKYIGIYMSRFKSLSGKDRIKLLKASESETKASNRALIKFMGESINVSEIKSVTFDEIVYSSENAYAYWNEEKEDSKPQKEDKENKEEEKDIDIDIDDDDEDELWYDFKGKEFPLPNDYELLEKSNKEFIIVKANSKNKSKDKLSCYIAPNGTIYFRDVNNKLIPLNRL